MPAQRNSRDKGHRSNPRKASQARKASPQGLPAPAPETPGEPQQRLDVFVGTWKIEGDQIESPLGPAGKVDLTEQWDWLPGGFFLVNRLSGRVGQAPMSCVEVLGYDSEAGSYVMHSYYGDGHRAEWRVREKDGTWLYGGNWDRGATIYKIRCTAVVSPTGDAINAKWEYAGDGAPWKTFWDVRATRA